jgi:hypothetical protein
MMTYPKADADLRSRVWRLMQRHEGYERRISRDKLCYWMGASDRAVRDALAQLPVVWDGGYFVPKTKDEAAEYLAKMHSRQARIGEKIRLVEDWLRERREPEKVEQLELMEV